MEIIESSKDKTTVSLSSTELIMVNNALNEICNGFDIPEFETRIGYSRQQVKELLNQIHASIETVRLQRRDSLMNGKNN
jgi:hypothetical protein